MTKYIIDSYRAGNMFKPYPDGEVFTSEQFDQLPWTFDTEDEAMHRLAEYAIQWMSEGHSSGVASDNTVHEDAKSIADAIADAIAEEEPFDASFYSVPGYYEEGELLFSDEELSAGISQYDYDVTTYYVVAVEVEEELAA